MQRFALIACAALGLAASSEVARAGPGSEASPAEPRGGTMNKEAQRLVHTFFRLLSSGAGSDKALGLFLNPDTAVEGSSPGAGAGTGWTKTAQQFLAGARKAKPAAMTVGDIDVWRIGKARACVMVDYYAASVRGKAQFTLTTKGSAWRIASLVLETRPTGLTADAFQLFLENVVEAPPPAAAAPALPAPPPCNH